MFCWIFLSSNLLKEELSGTPIVRSQRWAKFIQCQKRLETKQSRIQLHSIMKKSWKKKLGFSLVSLRNFSAGDCSRVEESLILTRANFTGSRCLRSRPHILPFLPQPSHGPNTINTYKYDKYDLGFSMPPYDLLTVEREAVCFSSEATQAQACRDDLSCGTSEVHDFQRFRKVYLSIA